MTTPADPDPFGPNLHAADPISGGTITLRTDRSLDELDAVLTISGSDDHGQPMFGPTFYAEFTGHEAEQVLTRILLVDRPDDDDLAPVAARLRRLIAHTQEGTPTDG